MIRLLVIDSDADANRILSTLLPDKFSIIEYTQGTLAVDAVRRCDPDVVFLSDSLSDQPYDTILSAIVDLPIAPPLIVVASNINAAIVAKTIRAGAFSYITKPYNESEILEVVDEAVTENTRYRTAASIAHHPAISTIIGESPAMVRLKKRIARYAETDSPILLEGESGTGKDLIARAIHEVSRRHEGPFVPVNCGAIPLALFESEMFGAERGAYTGAVTRPGSFEQAHRGTLFLDEIGEMDPHAQVKLLRVIEDGEVVRVGGVRRISTDVRTVAATNKDLRDAMEKKEFRNDLYYRLNLLGLRVPALRDRPEDIPLLAGHFLRTDAPGKSMSTSAVRKLLAYDWPGNVRELRNVVNRAAYLIEGRRITASEILVL